jgi:hypothetical protein
MPTLKSKADRFPDFIIVDAMSEAGIVTLNGHAHVILSNVFGARNGVVHAIDTVLLPDDVAALASDGMSTIATWDDPLVAGGGETISSTSSSRNLLSPPTTVRTISSTCSSRGGVPDDDGGAHHDDAGNVSDDLVGAVEKWDDFFDGIISLDTIRDDDTFPSRDDWYDDNLGINVTNFTVDFESDQQVESSEGDCFSDLMCCFLFLCG